MRINTVFIHASLNMTNMIDQPSLINEIIDNKTILEITIEKLLLSKTSNIYIVCSDNNCDNWINETVLKFKKQKSIIDIIRISNEKIYALKESNFKWYPDKKEITAGFWTFECLNDYAEKLNLDRIMVLNLDDHFLINDLFIDKVFNEFKEDEYIFKQGNPVSKILLFSIDKIFKHFVIYKNEIEKIKNYELKKIIDLDKNIKTKKIKSIEDKYKFPILIYDIISSKQNKIGALQKPILQKLKEYKYCFSPCYTKDDVNNYRKIYNINLKETFDIEKEIYEKALLNYPGYIELELTNKCNLECLDCPCTKFTLKKQDLSFDKFKEIINQTVFFTPFLNLSGYGEPLLYKDLIKCISYAKTAGFFRVCLETNGTLLTDDLIKKLIDSKLDILILNLNSLDKYSLNIEFNKKNSEVIIEKILNIKEKNKSVFPKIFLHIISKDNNFEEIQEYYTRWEYLVDGILIQPLNNFCSLFNSKNTIDFTPLNIKDEEKQCLKTLNSLVILSNGKNIFCKQFYDKYINREDNLEVWRENIYQGKRLKECANCNQFYFKDIEKYNFNFKEIIMYLNKHLESIKEIEINKGNSFYNNKEYEKALDIWENVLKIDPSNEFIHKTLDELLLKYI